MNFTSCVGFELGISWLPDWRPGRHGHRELTFCFAIFDKQIQLLSHSKVAKAELYLICGYYNEWIELTYYIGTLVLPTHIEEASNTPGLGEPGAPNY